MQTRVLVRWRIVGVGVLTALMWGLMLASFSPKEAFRWHFLLGVGFFPIGAMWGSAMCRWMENALREDRARAGAPSARSAERSTAVPRARRDAPAPAGVAVHAVGS